MNLDRLYQLLEASGEDAVRRGAEIAASQLTTPEIVALIGWDAAAQFGGDPGTIEIRDRRISVKSKDGHKTIIGSVKFDKDRFPEPSPKEEAVTWVVLCYDDAGAKLFAEQGPSGPSFPVHHATSNLLQTAYLLKTRIHSIYSQPLPFSRQRFLSLSEELGTSTSALLRYLNWLPMFERSDVLAD